MISWTNVYSKCSKFFNMFSFCSQIKCWLSGLELTKMLDRIAGSLIWVCAVCLGLFSKHLVLFENVILRSFKLSRAGSYQYHCTSLVNFYCLPLHSKLAFSPTKVCCMLFLEWIMFCVTLADSNSVNKRRTGILS